MYSNVSDFVCLATVVRRYIRALFEGGGWLPHSDSIVYYRKRYSLTSSACSYVYTSTATVLLRIPVCVPFPNKYPETLSMPNKYIARMAVCTSWHTCYYIRTRTASTAKPKTTYFVRECMWATMRKKLQAGQDKDEIGEGEGKAERKRRRRRRFSFVPSARSRCPLDTMLYYI